MFCLKHWAHPALQSTGTCWSINNTKSKGNQRFRRSQCSDSDSELTLACTAQAHAEVSTTTQKAGIIRLTDSEATSVLTDTVSSPWRAQHRHTLKYQQQQKSKGNQTFRDSDATNVLTQTLSLPWLARHRQQGEQKPQGGSKCPCEESTAWLAGRRGAAWSLEQALPQRPQGKTWPGKPRVRASLWERLGPVPRNNSPQHSLRHTIKDIAWYRPISATLTVQVILL